MIKKAKINTFTPGVIICLFCLSVVHFINTYFQRSDTSLLSSSQHATCFTRAKILAFMGTFQGSDLNLEDIFGVLTASEMLSSFYFQRKTSKNSFVH